MRWRYVVIFILFIGFFFGIWTKLFYWQIVKAEELSLMGESQYAEHLEIPPIRGDIKTSDNFPIVTNKISYLVYANPQKTVDLTQESDVLSQILTINSASISAQLSLKDKVWVPLAPDIDEAIREKIASLHLGDIGFQETPTRFYPEASMAAQLIGFVGKDSLGNPKGYFGLEGYYDRQLQGRIGKTTIVHDAFGKPVLAKLTQNSGQQDGRTLLLHVDRVIQHTLEKQLKEGIDAYGAKSGMAVVMDPKTGAILAMASFPSFDPRSFWDFETKQYVNPLITDTYEPGSTFKPLVMSAALDAGLVTPTSICPVCDKPVTIGDYQIHTWDNKYFPNTNMIDVMIHSDNTGMVYLAQRLGLDRMLSYLNKFGVGQTTGIDLQGEFAPQLKSRQNWYPIDLATTGFGQGISVTPIELLDSFSAIANGGVRMEPHIVAKIDTPDGESIPIPPKQLDQPISQTTAKLMTEILVETTNKGEANFARLKGYRIAGKTGTASIPVNGHYDQSKTIASFIGFAPADNPKFCMLVILNTPTTSIYGAETAAPIFFGIAQNILDYYKIAPTENEQPTGTQ